MAFTIRESSIPASCGIGSCYVKYWIPDAPKAVVQICHGMAEHIARYNELAAALCAENYLVCGLDYKGHGLSLAEGDAKGFFSAVDGWDYNIRDVMELNRRVREEWPQLSAVLFGHSMGSFIARCVASRYRGCFDGYIFEGTSGANPVLGVARLIAAREVTKKGANVPSETLDNLAFGGYNKRIKNPRTKFDWLSRREDVVDKYVADDLCGFVFTAQGFYDLFTGLKEIQASDWAQKVPNVPIFIFAGDEDPVGEYGKGVKQVADKLTDSGHTAVRLKLYPGARHEVHNELCAEECYADIISWLREVVG